MNETIQHLYKVSTNRATKEKKNHYIPMWQIRDTKFYIRRCLATNASHMIEVWQQRKRGSFEFRFTVYNHDQLTGYLPDYIRQISMSPEYGPTYDELASMLTQISEDEYKHVLVTNTGP